MSTSDSWSLPKRPVLPSSDLSDKEDTPGRHSVYSCRIVEQMARGRPLPCAHYSKYKGEGA